MRKDKKIASVILSLVVITVSSLTNSYAADPTKEEMTKLINDTAKKIYDTVLSTAKTKGESIPSEATYGVVFGQVKIPAGISINPTDHSLTDMYKYKIVTYVCSTGISGTPCASQNTAQSNNNGSTNNNGSSATGTTPVPTTDPNGQGVSDPNTVTTSGTEVVSETLPKKVLPLLLKSLDVKQDGKSVFVKWAFKSKTASLVKVSYYNLDTPKKIKNISFSGSKKIGEIKDLIPGESYKFVVKVSGGRDYRTKELMILKPPASPYKINHRDVNEGVEISWLRDIATIMDPLYSEPTGTVVTVTDLTGVTKKKNLEEGISKIVFEGYKESDLSNIKIYFTSKVGSSDVKRFRYDVSKANAVKVTQKIEGSVNLSWRFDEIPVSLKLYISSIGNLRDQEIIELTPNTVSKEITNLTKNGNYTFKVVGKYSDEMEMSLLSENITLKPIPTAPSYLNVKAGNNSLLLNWPTFTDYMKYLTGYIVMFKGQNDSEFTTVSVPVGDYSTNPYILNNLVNGNSYQIKLLAVNEIGTSSPILSNGTPLLIPNSPSNLTGSSGNSFVDLNWDNSLSNGVTSHIIEYRLQGSTLWSSLNTNSALTSYRVNSLSSSTNYEFRVYSINPYGSSVASNTVTILTQSSINTITLLTPVVNSGNVSLTWSTPNSVLTSQQLTGFLVEYKISTDSIWSQIATTGVTQQYTFTSLNPGSTYNFRVSAVLSNGLSSLSTVSNTVSATINQIPNRVNNLVVSASGSSAILSWSAPTGFVSGTSYNVYYKTSSSNSYSLFANTLNLSTTVTGLSSNVNYNFMVKSLLSGVESEGSIVSSTIYNTPSGVNSLTLQRFISSPQSVTLSWLEPTDNGGSNVTSYRVEFKKNTDANYTVFLSNLLTNQVTISSLESGILYDFRVTAITIAGAGTSSSIQGTPYGVAKAPTSLGLTPSYNSVLVNYVPPTNTGGTAIINYNVYYRVVGSSNYTLASSLVTGNSYTITGLSTSSNYEVKITAQNAVGEGDSITNTTTTLTASVPSAITNLILAPANTLIAVSWSQPASSNGSAILGYRVKVLDLDTPGAVESVVDRGLNLAYTVTGLTNGINYRVTVTAYNSVGESPSVSLTGIPN